MGSGRHNQKKKRGNASPPAERDVSRTRASKKTGSLSPRSRSKVRGSSASRPSSRTSRPTSAKRNKKRRVGSPSTGEKAKSNGASARGNAGMSAITAEALASINKNLFTKSNVASKQGRIILMKAFLQAHSIGVRAFEKQQVLEHESIWQKFLDTSCTEHSREIKRLLNYVHLVESTCQRKLQHAHKVTHCALEGIQRLLLHINGAGTHIGMDTHVLTEKSDALVDSLGTEPEGRHGGPKKGNTSPVVIHGSFDIGALITDPHPPAYRIPQAELDERERLGRIFNSVLDSIGANNEEEKETAAPIPGTSHAIQMTGGSPTNSETEHSQPTSSTTPREHQQDSGAIHEIFDELDVDGLQAERTRCINSLQYELDSLGESFVQLMKRVRKQHQRYEKKILTQRTLLDSQATRLKIADDVLRDTVEQGNVESLSAVVVARQLSLELRERIDACERNIHEVLQALIDQSAEVCYDHDSLCEYKSIRMNKDDCLLDFMSRMERQVVEQAEVLRRAQNGIAEIWKLREQWQPGNLSEVTREADACPNMPEAVAGNSSPLPPPYKDRLRECDRETLLKFLELVALRCPGSVSHLIGILDEHDTFCATHPEEAAASREELDRTAAVVQLLQKMDEEGRLHCNPRHTSEALSVRIGWLVEQYYAYIDFNEAYARALVRQEDAERHQNSPETFAFFDPRTPVPWHDRSLPMIEVKSVKAQNHWESHDRAAASSSVASQNSPGEPNKNSSSPPPMPYLSLWKRKQQDLRMQEYKTGAMINNQGRNAVGRAVSYLQHHRPPLTTYGVETRAATSPNNSFESGPSVAPSRLRTIIGASAVTRVSKNVPSPPVPPRKEFISCAISVTETSLADT